MGLDTIIASIKDEAELEKQKILSKAENEAQGIIAQAETDAQNEFEKILSDTENKCKLNLKNAYSANLALDSKSILNAKVEAIYEIIEQLKNTVIGLPDNEYFDFMKRLIIRYAQKPDGVVLFGTADFERVPADFLQSVNAEINNPVSLSKKPAKFSNGFILKFGDIEENCSIDALLQDRKDDLKDKIAEVLFGD